MKLEIGREGTKNLHSIIEANLNQGYEVFIENRVYYITVLNHGLSFGEANFRAIPDGVYRFVNDQVFLES